MPKIVDNVFTTSVYKFDFISELHSVFLEKGH